MNKYVTGALALAVAGSAAYADPGNSDWLELDSGINTLATSTNATGDYANIKVLLRTGFIYGDDGLVNGRVLDDNTGDFLDDGASLSGFRLMDAEINGGTQIGDVAVRLGFDLAGRNMDLQDAYAMWACGGFDVIAGNYKPHITRTGFTDPENLFFMERSVIGASNDFYDTGIGFRSTMDQFSFGVDVMNSGSIGHTVDMLVGSNSGFFSSGIGNSIESGHEYILRAIWNFGREPGNYETDPEDAYGASDDLVGSVGFFYTMDDIINHGADTEVMGLDGQGTMGQFGFGFEVEDRADDAIAVTGSNWNEVAYHIDAGGTPIVVPGLVLQGDSNPFMLYGTYQVNEQFGVGLRYEDLDNGDVDDNSVITLGGNMYDVGHNGKLSANLVQISSDFDDTTVFQVGYTFGASR
jgi:hypothetical protein